MSGRSRSQQLNRQLVVRMERALFRESAEAANILTRSGQAAVSFDLAGGKVILMGPRFYVNGLFGAGLDGPISDRELAKLEGASRRQGTSAQIHVSPWADESLTLIASERGYLASEYRDVMFRSLTSGFSSDAGPTQSTNVAIDRVTPDTLRIFQATVASAHEIVDADRREPSDVFSEVMLQVPGSSLYVARIDGRPVATGSLTVHQGVAVLGGMATIPSARGQGLQQDLIAYRIAEAWRFDCDVVTTTVQPGSGSQRNLHRAGFQVAYTQVILSNDLC